VQAAPAGPKLPTPPFNFANLTSNAAFSFDVDEQSLTALRVEDGVLVGGIFRVRASSPSPTPLGADAWTFINALVARCGKNELMLMASRAYGVNGNTLHTRTDISVFNSKNADQGTTISSAYTYLCAKGRAEPTPIGKGNRLPSGYTSFWSTAGS
jgi:hypothetical protein